jgi:hypothetical protein
VESIGRRAAFRHRREIQTGEQDHAFRDCYSNLRRSRRPRRLIALPAYREY